MSDFWLYRGDCVEVLRAWPDNSVDAVVCDPPYGLEFMGKEWDNLSGGFSSARGRGEWAEAHGVARKGFDGYGPLPNYIGGGNIKCPDCGRPVDGRNPEKPDPRGGYRCVCGGAKRLRANLAATAMQQWHEVWAREALRVLKPGGHLLAFGGSRTYHRLACAIEDAGFEVRDSLMWLYGSGFPKSLNVGKAMDAQLLHGRSNSVALSAVEKVRPAVGMVRRVVSSGRRAAEDHGTHGVKANMERWHNYKQSDIPVTASVTDAAKQWEGWGTALKPSHEPIVLARKPLDGTVAANVQKWGTGALNIDGCRIPTTDKLVAGGPLGVNAGDTRTGKALGMFQEGTANTFEQHAGGRWPANVMLDEEAAAMLDRQADASRFFYVAKPSRRERDHGLDAFPARSAGEATDREDGSAGLSSPRAGAGRTGGARNIHPTVKPVALMRQLIRLVTPPGGIVLDPFVGSGSTGMAARLEGARFVGIDLSAEYLAIAHARISAALTLK